MAKKKPEAIEENIPLERGFPSGVVKDTRPEEQKAKDFRSEELFAAAPTLTWVDWVVKQAELKDILATIPVQNQDGSYSCVSQAGSLAMAINNWIEEGRYERMSARSIYPYRRNKPELGMWADDLGAILTSRGVVFEDNLPSEGMDEAKMNDLSDFLPSFVSIGKIYRAKNYLWIAENDIEAVAAVLAQGKPAVMFVRFGDGEWAKEVPTINEQYTTYLDFKYGHAITILPKAFFTYNGKKAVLIQDSWGIETGMNGRRILTEDWFTKKRVSSVMWFPDLQNLAYLNDGAAKPSYVFSRDLTVGMKGNDVAMLQRCLGYLKDAEGYLFPLIVEPTGNYFGITRSAVKRFQKLYNLTQTGNVDKPTKDVLNVVFK